MTEFLLGIGVTLAVEGVTVGLVAIIKKLFYRGD
jgi:hypothetical protein